MKHHHHIKEILGAARDPSKTYPHPLPPSLLAWYCSPLDGGHCILCALRSLYTPGGNPWYFLVPVPVKSVLRAGYTEEDGYILVDLPYTPQTGLVTPSDETEWT